MTYKVWGTLEEGEEPGTVIGELRDEFGVVFILTGTLPSNQIQPRRRARPNARRMQTALGRMTHELLILITVIGNGGP